MGSFDRRVDGSDTETTDGGDNHEHGASKLGT
jgi:hypothetical protein